MFTALIALAAGVVGFLAGAFFACWTLDDDEPEADTGPTITSSAPGSSHHHRRCYTK
jgi:hypothetical protein